MNTLSSLSAFTYGLGWALFHSMWQGLVLFAGLQIVLKIGKKTSPAIKYALSLFALFAMLAWFLITWHTEWLKLMGTAIYMPGRGTRIVNVMAAQRSINFSQAILLLFDTLLPYTVTVYVAGLVLLLCRHCINMADIQKLRNSTHILSPEHMQAIMGSLKDRLHIIKRVELFISSRVVVPMVIGFLKPVILLPVSAASQLNTKQIEAILLHELAHIKRNDYLVNQIQVCIEIVLFFNPFVWLTSSIIRTERELCCDDMVLAGSVQPLLYAHALAALAMQPGEYTGLAVAATGQKRQLLHRIKRIAETRKASVNYGRITIMIALLSVIVISLMWLTPALVQKKKITNKLTKQHIWINSEKLTVIDSNGNKVTYDSLEALPQSERKKLLTIMGSGTQTFYGAKGKMLVKDKDSVHVVFPKRSLSLVFASLSKQHIVQNPINVKEIKHKTIKSLTDSSAQGNDKNPRKLDKIDQAMADFISNNEIDSMLAKLTTDGLLSKDKYIVEIKKGKTLIIDGTQQCDSICKKYIPLSVQNTGTDIRSTHFIK